MNIESYARDTLYLGSMFVGSMVIVGVVYSVLQGDGPFELVSEMATTPFWWLLVGGFLFLVLLPGYRKAN